MTEEREKAISEASGLGAEEQVALALEVAAAVRARRGGMPPAEGEGSDGTDNGFRTARLKSGTPDAVHEAMGAEPGAPWESSRLPRPADGRWIREIPGRSGGQPHIAGTRIKVQSVALRHGRMRLSADEIAADYDLPLGAVYAALAHYFDHQPDIDARTAEDEAYAESARRQTPSLVETKRRGRNDPLPHR